MHDTSGAIVTKQLLIYFYIYLTPAIFFYFFVVSVDMKLHDENKKLAKLLHFGGSEGFKVIFHRFYAPLCSFASRYLEGEEVEDVVQETMMWLWEHRDSLLPDVNVTSLLFTMVRNKCLNHVRHLTRRQRVHEKLG